MVRVGDSTLYLGHRTLHHGVDKAGNCKLPSSKARLESILALFIHFDKESENNHVSIPQPFLLR